MLLKKYTYLILLSLSILLGSAVGASCQTEIDTTSSDNQKVNIKSAESMVHTRLDGNEIDSLKGDIRLYQDSTFMFCDTAIIVNKEHLVAYGNVIILQNDTIQTYCDSLSYESGSKQAELFGQVILINGKEKLNTNYLKYNLGTKKATYTDGGILTKGNTKLSSKRGIYYVNEKVAYFAKEVKIIDEDLTVSTDTLTYSMEEEKATFLGPTIVTDNNSEIYCESGYYLVPQKSALFEDNAQYISGAKRATADQIFYEGGVGDVILEGNAKYFEGEKEATAVKIVYNEKDETTRLTGDAFYKDGQKEVASDVINYNGKTESVTTSGKTEIYEDDTKLIAEGIEYNDSLDLGHAFGNVVWEDTVQNLKIYCDDMYYSDTENYVKAFGTETRPRLESLMLGDTLFLVADTLVSLTVTDSLGSKDIFNAYENVKVFKEDLQAVCDSLTYSASDSLFVLYDDPILWSDTTQMTGDTIKIILGNHEIDSLKIFNNGFVINENSDAIYNQMKGQNVFANFIGGKLNDMILEGNSESIYFMQDDDDAYIGMNKSLCNKILVLFEEDKISDIRFLTNPASTMSPLDKLSDSEMKLDGFKWYYTNRPLSIFDLK